MPGTERLSPSLSLLRFDRFTGRLTERSYQVSVVAGPDVGNSRVLDQVVVAGSHPDASFPLTDTTVSRYHVELTARPDGVVVKDLDSTNGTYVGGARIREAVVEDRATFTVGKTTLRVALVEADLGEPDQLPSFGPAIGAARVMKQMFGVLERVAPTDSTILLMGETGTGKEVLARAIHERSRRAKKPFVVVDCGAVAPTLVESELFGHVRGAFTGAIADRNGAFLEADGGTIFLDELGELPLDLQPKLLRVLEGGMVRRVGDDRTREVDVRVIAATHRDLEAEIAASRFRRDLFYRLAVVVVTVPPLRDRLDDLPLLAHHFVRTMGRGDFELNPGLLDRFRAYHWPGNVRELRNLIERALAGADVEPPARGEVPGRPLGAPALKSVSLPSSPEALTDLKFKEAKERLVESFTREYLVAMLEKCEGNISRLAREAGIARNYVHRLVARYGLKATDADPGS